MVLIFHIQVPVSKFLLFPVRLFLCMFSFLVNPTCWNTFLEAGCRILVAFFMSHFFEISSLGAFYFSIFPISLLFIYTSPSMVTSMILPSFLVLSITAISGPQASIFISRWIMKSHRILYSSFSITPSRSCSYYCGAPSHPYFSYSLQYDFLHYYASFYILFGLTTYIPSQYVILSQFLLHIFYIGLIQQPYLYEIIHSFFQELALGYCHQYYYHYYCSSFHYYYVGVTH